MKKFVKWLDEDLEEGLLMVLLVAIAVVMMSQVLMRYCFRQSMTWPEEFCRFCFVHSGFISIGYCVRKGKMLKVDILVGLFPKILQKALDVIGKVVTLLFFSYLLYFAYQAMMNSYVGGMKSAAMEWPMWTLYASVFIGYVLGVFRQAQELIRLFISNVAKKPEEGEAI